MTRYAPKPREKELNLKSIYRATDTADDVPRPRGVCLFDLFCARLGLRATPYNQYPCFSAVFPSFLHHGWKVVHHLLYSRIFTRGIFLLRISPPQHFHRVLVTQLSAFNQPRVSITSKILLRLYSMPLPLAVAVRGDPQRGKVHDSSSGETPLDLSSAGMYSKKGAKLTLPQPATRNCGSLRVAHSHNSVRQISITLPHEASAHLILHPARWVSRFIGTLPARNVAEPLRFFPVRDASPRIAHALMRLPIDARGDRARV